MWPLTMPVTRNCCVWGGPPAFNVIFASGGLMVRDVSPGIGCEPPPELLPPCKFDGLNAQPSAHAANTTAALPGHKQEEESLKVAIKARILRGA